MHSRTRTQPAIRVWVLLWAILAVLAAPLLGTSPAFAASPGKVVAWGSNANGQASVPAGLTTATALAAGGNHNLALKNDGTVVAWGYSGYGLNNIPAGLAGVTAIATGSYHNLALKNTGMVVAWGDSTYGQLSVPAGLSNVTAIAAGSEHSLALKSDGTLVGWGGSNAIPATIPAGLNGVTAIAARGIHNLVLKNNGTVVAWGYSGYGLNNIPTGLAGVTAIATGDYHNLALKSDGTIVAWGNNANGQTSVPAGLNSVIAIAAGGSHSLALKSNGTVVAWGLNTNGQTSIPASATNVSAIAAGGSHSLALLADTTAPVITPNIAGTLGANGWYISNVTVTWSVVDNESAITSQSGCGATTITADTNGTTLTCTATSIGGGSNKSVLIKRDKTAPTLAAGAKKADNTPYTAGTWTNQAVTVSFSCNDAFGVAACSAPVALNSGVTPAVNGTATDNAGNSAATSFGPVQIDTTAPTATTSATKADNTAYTAGTWTNQNVTVSFACGDQESGVVVCPSPMAVNMEGVTPAIQGPVSDNAGNSITTSFGPVQIDKTAPVITASATKADNSPYIAGSWSNQNVTVRFTCTDNANGSGVSFCPAAVVVSNKGGVPSVSGAAPNDKVGNTGSPISFGPVLLDTLAPTISAKATTADGKGYKPGVSTSQDVTVTFTCADSPGGSGLATCPSPVVVSAAGVTPSVTGTATDGAGNSTSVSFGPIQIDRPAA